MFSLLFLFGIRFAACFSSTFIFGAITMLAGIVGLTLGCFLSQRLKPIYPRADPIICGVGLLISAPLLLGCTFAVTYNIALCYILLFLGQVALNLNWSIVSDILLVRLNFNKILFFCFLSFIFLSYVLL